MPATLLTDPPTGEPSAAIRERVLTARARQRDRHPALNADLRGAALRTHCQLDGRGRSLIRSAIDTLGLSARAYHRVLKVARTIADLAAEEAIHADHVAEALQYRLAE